MNRTTRIAGLLLASLTISTVALAQQGGGGGQGGGSGGPGGNGGGGDSGVIEFLLGEHEKARLTRAVERRRGSPNDCLTHACNPPPRRPGRPEPQPAFERCGGDSVLARRNAHGVIVSYACDPQGGMR
jgi:hypothetical protein